MRDLNSRIRDAMTDFTSVPRIEPNGGCSWPQARHPHVRRGPRLGRFSKVSVFDIDLRSIDRHPTAHPERTPHGRKISLAFASACITMIVVAPLSTLKGPVIKCAEYSMTSKNGKQAGPLQPQSTGRADGLADMCTSLSWYQCC